MTFINPFPHLYYIHHNDCRKWHKTCVSESLNPHYLRRYLVFHSFLFGITFHSHRHRFKSCQESCSPIRTTNSITSPALSSVPLTRSKRNPQCGARSAKGPLWRPPSEVVFSSLPFCPRTVNHTQNASNRKSECSGTTLVTRYSFPNVSSLSLNKLTSSPDIANVDDWRSFLTNDASDDRKWW